MADFDTAIIALAPWGYWKLNEASGTTAVDSSGNSHTGTYSGIGVTYGSASVVPAYGDPCVTLDGSSGQVTLPTTGLPTGATLWSLMFACNVAVAPGSDPGIGVQFGSWGTNHAAAVLGLHTALTPTCTIFGQDATSASAMSTGAQHLLFGVWDGANFIVYVDGTSMGSNSTAPSVVSSSANIGVAGGGNWWKGAIGRVAIWSGTALSPTQIATLFVDWQTVVTNIAPISIHGQWPNPQRTSQRPMLMRKPHNGFTGINENDLTLEGSLEQFYGNGTQVSPVTDIHTAWPNSPARGTTRPALLWHAHNTGLELLASTLTVMPAGIAENDLTSIPTGLVGEFFGLVDATVIRAGSVTFQANSAIAATAQVVSPASALIASSLIAEAVQITSTSDAVIANAVLVESAQVASPTDALIANTLLGAASARILEAATLIAQSALAETSVLINSPSDPLIATSLITEAAQVASASDAVIANSVLAQVAQIASPLDALLASSVLANVTDQVVDPSAPFIANSFLNITVSGFVNGAVNFAANTLLSVAAQVVSATDVVVANSALSATNQVVAPSAALGANTLLSSTAQVRSGGAFTANTVLVEAVRITSTADLLIAASVLIGAGLAITPSLPTISSVLVVRDGAALLKTRDGNTAMTVRDGKTTMIAR